MVLFQIVRSDLEINKTLCVLCDFAVQQFLLIRKGKGHLPEIRVTANVPHYDWNYAGILAWIT